MKWLTYKHPITKQQRAGYVFHSYIVDLEKSLLSFQFNNHSLGEAKHKPEPDTGRKMPKATPPSFSYPYRLIEYITDLNKYVPAVEAVAQQLRGWGELEWKEALQAGDWIFDYDSGLLAAPLPKPSSFRDFYAFEEHVVNARKRRGLSMVPEWYRFPTFYFSNHQSICAPNEDIRFPQSSKKWDYELEVGVVIGKQGRNIKREEAFEYIFGLTIINDWSARDIQAEEVKVGLGPAKGKDFATTMGPYIVTAEEWQDRLDGEHVQLTMEAFINGHRTSSGNLSQLYFSIPELIAHASQDCTLYPGDILGTGTVGTGCLLEQGDRWLQAGDKVKLKVERLGELECTIKA